MTHSDFSGKVSLGYMYEAEYEKVTVWDTFITTIERVRAVTGEMPPGKTPVQGWWNYDLKMASKRMDKRLEGNILGERAYCVPYL